MICTLDSQLRWVVSSCTGTQRNETLTNCVTTPCMDMKTIGIPPCTSTPGQPPEMFRFKTLLHHCAMFWGKIPNFLSASPNCEGALKVLGVEQRGEATYESPTSQEEKRYSQSHCATWPLRLELSHGMKITLPYASLLWHHLGLRVLTELFKVKGACTIQFIILSVLQFLFLRLKLDDNVNVSGSIFRR